MYAGEISCLSTAKLSRWRGLSSSRAAYTSTGPERHRALKASQACPKINSVWRPGPPAGTLGLIFRIRLRAVRSRQGSPERDGCSDALYDEPPASEPPEPPTGNTSLDFDPGIVGEYGRPREKRERFGKP